MDSLFEGLRNAFERGGWPMYVNLCTAAIVISIITERVIVLYVQSRGLNKATFMTQLTSLIVKGDYRKAVTLCDQVPHPITRIVKAGLVSAPNSDVETQAAMDQASLRELPKLEHRTGYLAMLGNVATLIGLLGTIIGLIHAFGAVATADPSEKASLLAKGISEAMNNTAFGLGIAVPALLTFSAFQGRTQVLVDDINEVAVTILNLVTNNRKNLKNVKDEAAA